MVMEMMTKEDNSDNSSYYQCYNGNDDNDTFIFN